MEVVVDHSGVPGVGAVGDANPAPLEGDEHDAVTGYLLDSIDSSSLDLRDGIVQIDSEEASAWHVDGASNRADPQVEFPDFAGLFDGPSDVDGFVLTPRTASWLYSSAAVLADDVFDDVIEHGDAPATGEGHWSILDGFPRITRNQDAIWRRQAARAFDDLAHDLEAGRWPHPTCTAEEYALHRIIGYARDAVEDREDYMVESVQWLPAHPNDGDWESLLLVLFQDHDVLMLDAMDVDGIEDPGSEPNQLLRIGDSLEPHQWFRPFDNVTPRDARRPFRR